MAMNEFLVGMRVGGLIVIQRHPGEMTREQALELAAWLVAVAGGGVEAFAAKYAEVCS